MWCQCIFIYILFYILFKNLKWRGNTTAGDFLDKFYKNGKMSAQISGSERMCAQLPKLYKKQKISLKRRGKRLFLTTLLTPLAQKSGQHEVKMGGETRDIIGGKPH